MGARERPKGSHIIFYTVFFSLIFGSTVARTRHKQVEFVAEKCAHAGYA